MKEQYPNNRKHTTSTWDLLCVAAISSNTNEGFLSRIVGIYPNIDYLKLKHVVTATEAFYDRFIYTKSNLMQMISFVNFKV